MQLIYNGRKIEITGFDWSNSLEDSFIESAYYVDSGKELDEDDLEELTHENSEFMYEHWMEEMAGRAEDRYDYISGR